MTGYGGAGSKLAIGLPPMQGSQQRVASTKSLNVSGIERISLYRNEDERQNVMKSINEKQASYQRLLVQKRSTANSTATSGIPLKPGKPAQKRPKGNLEQKNLAAL